MKRNQKTIISDKRQDPGGAARVTNPGNYRSAVRPSAAISHTRAEWSFAAAGRRDLGHAASGRLCRIRRAHRAPSDSCGAVVVATGRSFAQNELGGDVMQLAALDLCFDFAYRIVTLVDLTLPSARSHD